MKIDLEARRPDCAVLPLLPGEIDLSEARLFLRYAGPADYNAMTIPLMISVFNSAQDQPGWTRSWNKHWPAAPPALVCPSSLFGRSILTGSISLMHHLWVPALGDSMETYLQKKF